MDRDTGVLKDYSDGTPRGLCQQKQSRAKESRTPHHDVSCDKSNASLRSSLRLTGFHIHTMVGNGTLLYIALLSVPSLSTTAAKCP